MKRLHPLQPGAMRGDEEMVFTDPNGTRPASGKELTEVWSQGLPDDPRSGEPWPLLQRDALASFVADNDNFYEQNATDVWQDLQRL